MFSSLSYTSNIHLHRDGIFRSRLCPPRSIIDQENVSQTCLQDILMGTTPQQRKPPNYVNFSTKMNHHNVWYRCPAYGWELCWHFCPAVWLVMSFCVYYCPLHNETSPVRAESCTNLVPCFPFLVYLQDSSLQICCFEASWYASSWFLDILFELSSQLRLPQSCSRFHIVFSITNKWLFLCSL